MSSINIAELDKVECFRRLYNNSKPQGMGLMIAVPEDMSYTEATSIFNEMYNPKTREAYFDYVKGRVMKVGISAQEVRSSYLYDRDLGPGACSRVIEAYRKE